jgi:signal transduction histidine kinase
MSALLSTLLSLPDDERAAVERELVLLSRSAALGELAADVAHDVANPLFGVIGLVDLLLEDAAAGSEEEDRLRLLQQSALEMKGTLRLLLDFARGKGVPTLAEAARQSVALVRHGIGKTVVIEERYADEGIAVPCPPDLLLQAVLQLVTAARSQGKVALEVSGRSLRVTPAPPDSVGLRAAARIAADTGGALDREDGSLRLHWTG